jgi:hypothetical protein
MGKRTFHAKNKSLKEDSNSIADKLARVYTNTLDPQYKPRSMPLACPNYNI